MNIKNVNYNEAETRLTYYYSLEYKINTMLMQKKLCYAIKIFHIHAIQYIVFCEYQPDHILCQRHMRATTWLYAFDSNKHIYFYSED
jgi:hypothetical protein